MADVLLDDYLALPFDASVFNPIYRHVPPSRIEGERDNWASSHLRSFYRDRRMEDIEFGTMNRCAAMLKDDLGIPLSIRNSFCDERSNIRRAMMMGGYVDGEEECLGRKVWNTGDGKKEYLAKKLPSLWSWWSGMAMGSLPENFRPLPNIFPSNDHDETSWWETKSTDKPMEFLSKSTEFLSKPTEFLSSDEFRMFEFKVRKCMRGRSHDWTECPFAHPGEKARRRDPCRYRYFGSPCPDFRKGSCTRGDGCDFAHGVFEIWLHPSRYRTEICKDGTNCRRKVCFFAHSVAQLRHCPSPTKDLGSNFFDGNLFGDEFLSEFQYRRPPQNISGDSTSLCVADKFDFGAPSPTSTLVGHFPSPPCLSPLASPSNSPLLQTPPNAHFAISHELQANSRQHNGPLLSPAHNSSPFISSNSTPNRAHRSHSVPLCPNLEDDLDILEACEEIRSTHGMNQLFAPLDQLDFDTPHQLDLRQIEGLNKLAGECEWLTKSANNVAHIACSASNNSKWAAANDVGELPLERVESGQELRAAIYKNLRNKTS